MNPRRRRDIKFRFCGLTGRQSKADLKMIYTRKTASIRRSLIHNERSRIDCIGKQSSKINARIDIIRVQIGAENQIPQITFVL